MNKIKNFLVCLLVALIPLCSRATKTDVKNFEDLYRLNSRLFYDRVVDVYDGSDQFYNKLSINHLKNDNKLKLFNGEYKFISNNNVCNSTDFVFEVDLGHRNINNDYTSKLAKNFNITNIALKTYFSYNINSNRYFRNAFNFGLLAQDNIMFGENKGKISFKQIDATAFVQYYNRMIFNIFRIENIATIGYNHVNINDFKYSNGFKFPGAFGENYFNTLLKTRVGIDILTEYIDINTSLVALYNARLNNTQLYQKHKFIVGLENEFNIGMVGIGLDAKYNIKDKDLLFIGNVYFKF